MVKRYDITCDAFGCKDVENDDEYGDWVSYDDHAAELATLRAENAALKDVIDDLPDYIEAFRAFKEKGCKSRREYAQVVEDIVGIARVAKEALK